MDTHAFLSPSGSHKGGFQQHSPPHGRYLAIGTIGAELTDDFVVMKMYPGSPMERSGLCMVGDRILAADGFALQFAADRRHIIGTHGTEVNITLQRGGRRRDVHLLRSFGPMPEEMAAAQHHLNALCARPEALASPPFAITSLIHAASPAPLPSATARGIPDASAPPDVNLIRGRPELVGSAAAKDAESFAGKAADSMGRAAHAQSQLCPPQGPGERGGPQSPSRYGSPGPPVTLVVASDTSGAANAHETCKKADEVMRLSRAWRLALLGGGTPPGQPLGGGRGVHDAASAGSLGGGRGVWTPHSLDMVGSGGLQAVTMAARPGGMERGGRRENGDADFRRGRGGEPHAAGGKGEAKHGSGCGGALSTGRHEGGQGRSPSKPVDEMVRGRAGHHPAPHHQHLEQPGQVVSTQASHLSEPRRQGPPRSPLPPSRPSPQPPPPIPPSPPNATPIEPRIREWLATHNLQCVESRLVAAGGGGVEGASRLTEEVCETIACGLKGVQARLWLAVKCLSGKGATPSSSSPPPSSSSPPPSSSSSSLLVQTRIGTTPPSDLRGLVGGSLPIQHPLLSPSPTWAVAVTPAADAGAEGISALSWIALEKREAAMGQTLALLSSLTSCLQMDGGEGGGFVDEEKARLRRQAVLELNAKMGGQWLAPRVLGGEEGGASGGGGDVKRELFAT